MRSRMFGVVVLAVLLGLVSTACAKKVKVPKGGVKLTAVKAIGKSLHYDMKIQKYTETSHDGATFSRLVKGSIKADVDVTDERANGSVAMHYKLHDVSISVFENQQLKESEEVKDLEGLEFTALIGTLGTVSNVENLDLEEEFKKKEITPTDFILSMRLPQEPIKEGYVWADTQETTFTKNGIEITQKMVRDFRVEGFKVIDKDLCVLIRTKGNVSVLQKGQTKSQSGDMIDVDITAEGESKGKIVFDVDGGYIRFIKATNSVDVKGKQKNLNTNEERPVSYFSQQTLEAKLTKVEKLKEEK